MNFFFPSNCLPGFLSLFHNSDAGVLNERLFISTKVFQPFIFTDALHKLQCTALDYFAYFRYMKWETNRSTKCPIF